MLTRLTAVILGQYDTGETSGMVHVLSAERGPLSVNARGIRAGKSRAAAAVQPLALVELQVLLRPDSDVALLREASLVHAHREFESDIERLALASLAAEVAAAGSSPHQPAPVMLQSLVEALEAIASCPRADLAAEGAMAVLALLRISGHEPRIAPELLEPWGDREKPASFRLDVARGLVVLPEAVGGTMPRGEAHPVLPPEAVRAIHDAQRGAPRTAGLGPAASRRLLEALCVHAEHHLGRALRSARFWRELGG